MSLPRFHVETPLTAGLELALPPGAARHVQVLRLQPGAALTLFDGRGGEWSAEVLQMGRRDVVARVQAHHPIDRELRRAVTLALGMPANERMDTLVEKATELGVATVQPLVCERSVLRVAGERAERKAAHWQAIATAACEQSGRNRVPEVAAPLSFREWLAGLGDAGDPASLRWLLSLDPTAPRLLSHAGLAEAHRVTVLSGPEGGLGPDEQASAVARGFVPVSLGPRVLRADTAPLAALACLAAIEGTH
ncbi:16S rRNA (uracil(1498)-N(3))-methyltransferase [Ideonella sp. A 288]|uniref:16S rRNA (uracil(1498)-N(3))-methyltransferase n=1 Tax=Ideonella sp. A 288 TaxID=1962181 RepID=UPI0018FE0BA1|nr:16S rRNA (uracil(1498)-N(3))-methyltransferase [Ideonella sp. A 288]